MNLFQRLCRVFGKQPRPDHRVRLYQFMRARGVFVLDPPTAAEAREFKLAIRRCLRCATKDLCDELFAKDRIDGHRHFCPNMPYIEQLVKEARSLDRDSGAEPPRSV